VQRARKTYWSHAIIFGMSASVYARPRAHIHTRAHTHIQTRTRTHANTHAHTHSHTHRKRHTHIGRYTCIQAHKHTHTHTHTHTNTQRTSVGRSTHKNLHMHTQTHTGRDTHTHREIHINTNTQRTCVGRSIHSGTYICTHAHILCLLQNACQGRRDSKMHTQGVVSSYPLCFVHKTTSLFWILLFLLLRNSALGYACAPQGNSKCKELLFFQLHAQRREGIFALRPCVGLSGNCKELFVCVRKQTMIAYTCLSP